jgi:hypothetical protein
VVFAVAVVAIVIEEHTFVSPWGILKIQNMLLKACPDCRKSTYRYGFVFGCFLSRLPKHYTPLHLYIPALHHDFIY